MIEMSFTKIWENDVQFLMYSLKLGCYVSFDISIFGTEWFFKRLFDLPEILYLYLVSFDICIDTV